MIVRIFAAATLAFAVAACEERSPPAPAPEPRQTQSEPQARPASATPSYVGLWAADARLCQNPAWRFEAREITTLGEVHCAFNRVRQRPGGYDVDASCTAEAPPEPYSIGLTVETERTMTVQGGPWTGETNLIYCAPLPGG